MIPCIIFYSLILPPVEGETSSHEEKEKLTEKPVENNIQSDQKKESHENETKGSDDEDSDVDDSEPVISRFLSTSVQCHSFTSLYIQLSHHG